VGKPETVETVSKREFHFVRASLAIGLSIVELILWIIVSLKLHRDAAQHIGMYGYMIAMANWVVSWFAADRYFKTRGLSRSGISVETWDRLPAKPADFAFGNDAVEYHLSRSEVRFCFFFYLLFSLAALLFVCVAGLVGAAGENLPYIILGSVGCVLFGRLGLQQAAAWDGCQARVERYGVFGYPARLALDRKLLPWSEVVSCDIITRYDPFGRLYRIVPVFKDALGRKLMSLHMQQVPIEHQQRLVKYIKAKLPKARVDFAEF
jgi:hypothetical protein